MKRLSSTTWAQKALILAAVLLAVAGLILLGLYARLSSQAPADRGWVNPQSSVQRGAIAPDLAVLTLAGESDDRIARAALDLGERETAYATISYSVQLADATRSGQWLLLASNFKQDDPQKALTAYQALSDLLVLGAGLGDSARADISLQVARGLIAGERAWLAPVMVAQAETIARESVTLLPAQRRTILTGVASAYDALGQGEAAQSVRTNTTAWSEGPGIVVDPTAPVLPTLRGTVVLPDDVAGAFSTRQGAAAVMAARWLASGEAERAGLAGALGDALAQEDVARDAFYAQAGALALPDRLVALHDRIAWLTIKLRVARLGYGVSLVPAWETEVEAIERALSAAHTDLINGYGQLLDTLDAVEALPARIELLRQGVLAVRLGLFPNQAAEEALAQQLIEASQELRTRQGDIGLRVTKQDARGYPIYLLAGSDAARVAE